MQVHHASYETTTPTVTARVHRERLSAAEAAPSQTDAALLGALTVIAHDLRGPLANLAVTLELIETYSQVQAHERVKASTEKAQLLIEALGSMLNGFLQRARDTGDPLSFKPSSLDIGDVIASAIDLNRPIAESRDIEITCSTSDAVVISGDQRLLIEAVGNLVGNAVKFAPLGSTVTCSAKRNGGEVIIEVADEGQGLSELDLKRAFRPFSTLSAHYKNKTASWGLGLWIVRLIAERHGGRVDVSTAVPSGGARFRIHLPNRSH